MTQKDARAGPPESECHLVLAADVVARSAGALRWLAEALAPRGCVLLEEAARALDEPAARDAVARAGLTLVSRQLAAGCEYLLLRRTPELPEENVVIEVSAARLRIRCSSYSQSNVLFHIRLYRCD